MSLFRLLIRTQVKNYLQELLKGDCIMENHPSSMCDNDSQNLYLWSSRKSVGSSTEECSSLQQLLEPHESCNFLDSFEPCKFCLVFESLDPPTSFQEAVLHFRGSSHMLEPMA